MSETTQALWDNEEKTCYRIEFLEGWSWQDFSTVHTIAYGMLGKIERDIDLIVVFSGRVPQTSLIGHLSVGGDQPTNMRYTVFVNSTDFTTMLFIKSINATVDELQEWVGPHFVDTLEEARDYLAGLEESDV